MYIHPTCTYIYNIPIIRIQVGKQLCKSNLEPHWSLRDRAARLLTFICHRYSAPYSTLQQRITTTLMHAFLVCTISICVYVYICVYIYAHLHLPSLLHTLLDAAATYHHHPNACLSGVYNLHICVCIHMYTYTCSLSSAIATLHLTQHYSNTSPAPLCVPFWCVKYICMCVSIHMCIYICSPASAIATLHPTHHYSNASLTPLCVPFWCECVRVCLCVCVCMCVCVLTFICHLPSRLLKIIGLFCTI